MVASVIVVDNGSIDDSLKGVASFDLPLLLIRNGKNKGFATACNQGALQCSAKYILFLNPDTRIFSDSIHRPVSFLECADNANVGICSIQLLDDHGHITCSCARFPKLRRFVFVIFGLNRLPVFSASGLMMDDWDHATSRYVDQVIGAFFLVRRELLGKVGLFDERFFVYYEEVDFSYRAHLAGWRSVYLADAQAFHAGGGSSRKVKAARLFYSLRSRILYAFKHFNKVEAWAVLLLTLFVEPFTRFGYAIFRSAFREIRDTAQGYRMLWRDLPQFLKTAREHHD